MIPSLSLRSEKMELLLIEMRKTADRITWKVSVY